MKELRTLLLAASIASAFAVVLAPGVAATPDMSVREGRGCLTCHTAAGRPELNEAGEYYRDNSCSLDGYPEELPPPERQPAPDTPVPGCEPGREPEPEQRGLKLIRS